MNLGDLQPLLKGWQTNELIIIQKILFIVDLWCYLCLVHHYMKKLSVFFGKKIKHKVWLQYITLVIPILKSMLDLFLPLDLFLALLARI